MSISPQDKTDFQDYAVGGATAALNLDMKHLPWSLSQEITVYKKVLLKENIHHFFHRHQKKENKLYVIWIGANDYLDGRKDINKAVYNAIHSIKKHMSWLIQHAGARDFLIMNLPDLGQTPDAGSPNSPKGVNMSALANEHNQELNYLMTYMKANHPQIKIAFVNVYEIFNHLLQEPQYAAHLGQPCYSGKYWITAPNNLLTNSQKEQKNVLNNTLTAAKKAHPWIFKMPDIREAYINGLLNGMNLANGEPQCKGYIFWDHVHPVTTLHKLIAQYAFQVVNTCFNGGSCKIS